MGPFAVADMSGLDIAWRMRRSQVATRDPSARYVPIPDMLCEAGRLGQKTSAGYYAYPDGGKRQPDDSTQAIIDQARAAKGITPRAIEPDEIVRRVLVTMANEAALLLAEKAATRATDVDVVLVNGYGFPRWEGGPVFWARERGAIQLEKDLDLLESLSGPGFKRGNTRELLPASESS
jgi:3-hydroxyacyl-CoA dehydrogenase